MTYRLHPISNRNRNRRLRIWLPLALFLIGLTSANAGYVLAEANGGEAIGAAAGSVIISEIKSGGTTAGTPAEFVSLYNTNNIDIDLTGWKLEFAAKDALPAAGCGQTDWKHIATGTANVLPVSGIVPHNNFSPRFELGINNQPPGSVHLVDNHGIVQDLVGWGSDTAAASCFETAQAVNLIAGNSLQRYVGCLSGFPVDSGNNATDFHVSKTPARFENSLFPGCGETEEQAGDVTGQNTQNGNEVTGGTDQAPGTQANGTQPQTGTPAGTDSNAGQTQESDNASSSPQTGQESQAGSDSGNTVTGSGGSTANGSNGTQAVCNAQGVTISELLPNPAGLDSGAEYIELHNTADHVISLDNCSLNVANDSYQLGNLSLPAGTYLVLHDDTTGLTLPNASGGTVRLTGTGSGDIQTVTYPAAMDDDTVWADTGGSWAVSYTLTPNAANVATPFKPCDSGLVRNPDTNRCITVTATATADTSGTNPATDTTNTGGDDASATTFQPCAAGQERNPDTNRCRAIVTATASALAACPVGQVRNPDTNRCRSVTTAATAKATASTAAKAAAAAKTSTLAVCKQGQERNPDTNRCRAIATTASAAKACPAGQERNPDTNRCRKIVAGASTGNGSGAGTVRDVASESSSAGKPYWLIAVVAVVGALGYAIYEWRQEISLFSNRLFSRLGVSRSNVAARS